jgi:hypothetical protein
MGTGTASIRCLDMRRTPIGWGRSGGGCLGFGAKQEGPWLPAPSPANAAHPHQSPSPQGYWSGWGFGTWCVRSPAPFRVPTNTPFPPPPPPPHTPTLPYPPPTIYHPPPPCRCNNRKLHDRTVVTIDGYEDVPANDEEALLKAR